jgi:DNA-binding transcriptional LysR family regulator
VNDNRPRLQINSHQKSEITMLDRLTGMQVFVRVAVLGGLSAAARSLNMSPTLATKHIAALEERLEVKLLHRSTRRLTLTEAGRRYLDGVEKILVDVNEVEASAGA